MKGTQAMENFIYFAIIIIAIIILNKIITGIRNTFVRGKVRHDLNNFSKWCRDNKEELDRHYQENEEEITAQYEEERRKARGE